MLTDAQRQHLGTVVRTMQIIVGALAWGVLMFMGAVLFISLDPAGGGQPGVPLLTYLAVGTAAVAIAAAMIVPGMIADRQARSIAARPIPPAADELGDVLPLSAVYQTRLIMRAAILEGAAFFNLVAYMLERRPLCLGAAVVLLLLISAQFPTRSRVEEWFDSELTTVAQMRQMRSANVG